MPEWWFWMKWNRRTDVPSLHSQWILVFMEMEMNVISANSTQSPEFVWNESVVYFPQCSIINWKYFMLCCAHSAHSLTLSLYSYLRYVRVRYLYFTSSFGLCCYFFTTEQNVYKSVSLTCWLNYEARYTFISPFGRWRRFVATATHTFTLYRNEKFQVTSIVCIVCKM